MVAVMLLPKDNFKAIRWTSLVVSLFPMLMSFWITWDYFINHAGTSAMAYVEGPFNWIPTLNVQYYLGVDYHKNYLKI